MHDGCVSPKGSARKLLDKKKVVKGSHKQYKHPFKRGLVTIVGHYGPSTEATSIEVAA